MIISNLKEVMERMNVTYKELERRTGLSSQTITRARGKRIGECRLSTLGAIARALQVNLKELFEDEPDLED